MTTKPLTNPQRRIFHALCGEVAHHRPLVPYLRAFACEAWKRYFLACWVHEARLEAWQAGGADPFPVRPVPSSSLTVAQMSELLEFSLAYCAQHGIELSK